MNNFQNLHLFLVYQEATQPPSLLLHSSRSTLFLPASFVSTGYKDSIVSFIQALLVVWPYFLVYGLFFIWPSKEANFLNGLLHSLQYSPYAA